MTHPLAHLVPDVLAVIPCGWKIMLSYSEHHTSHDVRSYVGLCVFEAGDPRPINAQWDSLLDQLEYTEAEIRAWIERRRNAPKTPTECAGVATQAGCT